MKLLRPWDPSLALLLPAVGSSVDRSARGRLHTHYLRGKLTLNTSLQLL